MKSVTIIGAGLAGSLVALYLAQRGYEVELYESHADPRTRSPDRGLSINLAVSCRGLTGLAGVGLADQVKQLLVPMRARAIHEESGAIHFQAFGRHEDEYINAIQRSALNALLLDEIERHSSISLQFNMKLINLDAVSKTVELADREDQIHRKAYQHLIGADGAGSAVREALIQAGIVHSSRDFLPHGYKELSISSGYPDRLKREHLHLWPRDSYLLLGNPNQDQSITGSFFFPHEGQLSFATLDSEIKIKRFFEQSFPDVLDAMPDLPDEFIHHPTGRMSTIKTAPWFYEDHCLLIGDAAHGLVPFFGQGMNSAFEDCRILALLLERYQDDWQKTLPAFFASRKVNTDAVAAMSMDNYHEIQTDIRDEHFNLKKQLEQALMHRYPTRYLSKHVMVMFTNIGYAKAKACGDVQNAFLNEICSRISRLEDVKWKEIDSLMHTYDKKLTELSLNGLTSEF